MFQLLVLHWGEITQIINVSGVDARQGLVKPIERSSSLGKATGRGKVNGVGGSGGGGVIGGSC